MRPKFLAIKTPVVCACGSEEFDATVRLAKPPGGTAGPVAYHTPRCHSCGAKPPSEE